MWAHKSEKLHYKICYHHQVFLFHFNKFREIIFEIWHAHHGVLSTSLNTSVNLPISVWGIRTLFCPVLGFQKYTLPSPWPQCRFSSTVIISKHSRYVGCQALALVSAAIGGTALPWSTLISSFLHVLALQLRTWWWQGHLHLVLEKPGFTLGCQGLRSSHRWP